MKPMPAIMALLSIFCAGLLQGCGGNKGYQVIVEFPEPVADSKGATQTLWIYSIIPEAEEVTCDNLISGAYKLGNGGYQEEYNESIPYPFTKKVSQIKIAKKDTRTHLFFVEGDNNDQPILRGCTEVNPGGSHDVTVTLGIVCPAGWGDCDGNISTGCERDITTMTDCGKCDSACTNDHGQTACSSGVCTPTCDLGYSDCDGNPNNGCETDINSPSGCNGHGTCLFSNNTPTCKCYDGYDGDKCELCAAGYPGTYPDCKQCSNGYLGISPNCFLPLSLDYCLTSQCFAVPPTGQKDCYNNNGSISCPGGVGNSLDCQTGSPSLCGQDAQYAKVIKDQTFICYNGTNEIPCTGSANTNDVVVDSVTGLMWQRTSLPSQTWQQAIDYCASLTWASNNDWRLPNPIELHSIVDLGKYNPADSNPLINISVFPGTPSDLFWTSSSDVANSNNGWAVNFIHFTSKYNLVSNIDKNGSYYLRCVRGGPIPTGTGDGNRFITSTGGQPVVTDLVTGLVWQPDDKITACPTDSGCTTAPCRCSWENALKNCENSNYGGYPDWRLPNINELMSLINYNHNTSDPATDFPGKPTDKFWSSSCNAQPTSSSHPFALRINFTDGFIDDDYQSSTHWVRCVRLGP